VKLRPRLALTVLVAAVPLVALAQVLREGVERRAAVLGLAESARARMEAGGKELCERFPESFRDPPPWTGSSPELSDGSFPGDSTPPGQRRAPSLPFPSGPLQPRPPRIEMFAYGPDFVSANPDAEPFPAEYRRALEAGEREVGQITDEGDGCEIEAAVRMTWDTGPCAVMLAWRHDDRPALRPRDEITYAAGIVGGLLLAVLVAAGPVERRVRRLAAGVRRSAAEHYREPVRIEGRDEVAELARAFNAAGSEVRDHIEVLSARERSLRDFVENTTHDVMLPLTVLQGHLCSLRDAIEAGKPGVRVNVRDALEELDYLASLLQNLGAAAKLEAGHPDVRRDRFSWNALVERVVLRHTTIAREKDVELDYAVPEAEIASFGDVTLVEQALSNVVHNAVRYNKSGGHVAVVLETESNRFTVRVLDDGPGVPFQDLARIVERTFRGDAARKRHPGGTGLGLSIAKDVADRHGFLFELRRAETGGLEVLVGGPIAAPET
jgi:signal transduction histidine kinase